jgi:hypothetical protein
MGRLAMERLYVRMKEPAGPPQLTEFIPHIVIRRSCGASLREDVSAVPGFVPHASTTQQIL